MTQNQIEQTSAKAIEFALSGQLKEAIDTTRLLADELQWGDINDRLTDLHDNYRLMLQYYLQGVDDPERKRIFNKLAGKLLNLTILLREELKMRNFTSYEYTQKRYLPHKLQFNNTADLYDSISYYHQKKQLYSEVDATLHVSEMQRIRQNFERLLPDLFMIYWLNTSLGHPEKTVFRKILLPEYPGVIEKCLIVSALTLNLWRMFDEEKLMMLIEACEHPERLVRQRALVGLCFVMSRYNDYLPYYPAVRNRLMLLADTTSVLENLKNIILLIAGSSDTDRITRKMQDEILPEMMKISPKIKSKLDAESLMKSEDWSEENPEWNELLEQSGIGEKLQELTDLQLEGADVYMSTFAVLKNFPFFNETAHWFLPFDTEFSSVAELFSNKDQSLISAFLNNSVICNSDKYSFALSVMQMPTSQRDMMSRSFKSEADQLAEMTRDESILKPDLADKNIARQYIQDLFRFFRLHPQHSDFNDMFHSSLKMHHSVFFDMLAASSDLKEQLAEFYFTKNFYQQAVELYNELIKGTDPSAAMYQKCGFALQKLSRIDEALEAYKKADIIQPDDLWTVRKIALCYRLRGKYEQALEHYRHVDFLKPGTLNTRMQMAKCMIAMENYQDAMQVYTTLEKSYPEELKLWRAIGWNAFLTGNLFQAEYYLEKVLAVAPDAIDLLNAGHIALCLNKRTEAVEFYRKTLAMQDHSLEFIVRQMEADKSHLLKNGISADDIQLIVDALAYSFT
jgi:tetratricopeptide (TPR) repeat protein